MNVSLKRGYHTILDFARSWGLYRRSGGFKGRQYVIKQKERIFTLLLTNVF